MGLSHYNIFDKGNRYAQVLAQDTPRKLALLVGINYPNNNNLNSLNGCVNDVDLQQELLIHRFQFKKSDILRLTTKESLQQQPTRNHILTAFEEHLIKQAKPGDVVVFHFSGHGYRLLDPHPIQNCDNQQFNDDYNSTFVPVDDTLNGSPQDIMGRSLFLLISALKTNNVTVVLDSCFSGGGTRGNYQVRSAIRNNINTLEPSQTEIAYQESWMKRLKISDSEFTRRRCNGVAKGVILAAAQRDEEALDAPFDGFYAGAFTYAMTQYLWQETDSVRNAIAYISPTVKSTGGHSPFADGNQNQPVYFIDNKLLSTDAVITKVKGNQANLWLGGLNNKSLATFNKDATFSIVDATGKTRGKLKLESRDGLKAKAKLVDSKENIISLKPGMLLQESSRVIPADLHLSVGLDSSLGNEISIAETELSQIYRIKPVPALKDNISYPAEVQLILSRMTEEYLQILKQQKVENIPAVGSIGLFTQGLQIVPQSFAEKQESIKTAVCRLEPKLKSFLATRLVEMTLNKNSSKLDVEVSMNLVEQPNQPFAKISTLKSIYPQTKLPLNKSFQFQIKNNSSHSLYVMMLLIDSTGSLTVIHPYPWTNFNRGMLLASNDTLIIGEPNKPKLQAVKKGLAQALIITSRSSLDKAVHALKRIESELKTQKTNQNKCFVDQTRGAEVIEDLINDLSGERSGKNAKTREIKTSNIATVSFSFEVG
ncbi:MAG: caspase family protein [Rivularia sp. (in: Bacteria)]|nr:caspase family protein [Rivularia sp. MS3]